MKHLLSTIYLSAFFCFAGCSVENKTVPKEFKENKKFAATYPKYFLNTVPYNIAPLNFKFTEEGEQFLCKLSCGDDVMVASGEKIIFNEKKWSEFLNRNKGKSIKKELFVKNQGEWTRFLPDSITVSESPIDEYISYRMIEPSYVAYEDISIRQRNLSSFEESYIYFNRVMEKDNESNCINCHSYKNYDPNTFQFHVRQLKGGTVICQNGDLKKVDMKCDSLISSGVYPAWHPNKNLIAYSINDTHQVFHTRNNQKIEVFDSESDLILFDVDKNEVIPIFENTPELEVFPFWSPSGTELYYCVSNFEKSTADLRDEVRKKYKEIKYDIYKLSFDTINYTFGEPEIVVNASANGKSATLPRISPDGKYLLYTEGDYGVFHIWHKSSDLKMLNLETGKNINVRTLNSNDVESYHSWSSNGRWIIFSSRRDDGSFTRPYIAHFDENGKCRRPFILPQKDPDFYFDCYKSFNIPEFMTGPVNVSAREIKKVIDKNPIKAKRKL